MMANNWQRLGIALNLKNMFDYNEYVAACDAAGCPPHNKLEYAQKIGMVACGIHTYPDLPKHEAYLTFISDNQAPSTGITQSVRFEKVMVRQPDGAVVEQMLPAAKTGGCCGGGEVR